jgi:tetratricopeptide (TPR) repeat protein
MERARGKRSGPGALVAGLLLLAAPATGDLARGDAAWERRAEGARGDVAASEPVGAAIDAYEEALAAAPESLEARWKLVRALHFAGDFTGAGVAERGALFERAVLLSEAGLDALRSRAGAEGRLDELATDALPARVDAAGLARDDVARLHFWAAIAWGAWSRDAGLLTVVREGVASRLHRYALVSIELEPGLEQGGAFRLLGSLHAELPRVPLLTGWVDRERALALLERAFSMAPEHPGNQLLLATALLERAPARRDEALRLLDRAASSGPRPDSRIEDLAIRREARATLRDLHADG